MRLLSVDGWKLESFEDVDTRPRYAILSHRWEGNEVRFQDVETVHKELETGRANLTTKKNESITKIDNAKAQAKAWGLRWLWCDTCCIDSSSSAEVSEAINSMYNWYAGASICLAYIADQDADSFLAGRDVVKSVNTVVNGIMSTSDTKQSKPEWFTRGWTLQELLAPKKLMFFDKDWIAIGLKSDPKVCALAAKHTRIDAAVLTGERSLSSYSVARRMSWMADRRVTKKEDMAYSLLGIFNVNMPLLYGEGSVRAYRRLQQQIMFDSGDHSLFAWKTSKPHHEPQTWLASSPERNHSIIKTSRPTLVARKSVTFDLSSNKGPVYHGLLADSPTAFRDAVNIHRYNKWIDVEAYHESNRGLEIRLHLTPVPGEENLFLAKLNSARNGSYIGIYLKRLGYDTQQYARVRHDELVEMDDQSPGPEKTLIYVRQSVSDFENKDATLHFIVPRNLLAEGYKLLRQSHRPLSEVARKRQPKAHVRNVEWLTGLDDNGYLLARLPNKVSAMLTFFRSDRETEQLSILFATTADLDVGYHVVSGELPSVEEVERQLAKKERVLFTSGQKACVGAHVVKVSVETVIDIPRCLYVADIRINHSELRRK